MPAQILTETLSIAQGPVFALDDDWRRLARTSTPAMPFHDPSWHRHWWHHLARNDGRRRDVPNLLTARLPDGQLVGIAPLVATNRPGRGPAALRSLEFVGADKNITEFRGPLIHPGHESEVVSAWLGRLLERSDWDVLIWSGIRDQGPTHKLLVERSDVSWGFSKPMPIVALPDCYDEYRRSLSRNTKEALRKARNSGLRAGASFGFAVHSESVGSAVIDRFLALHWERSTALGAASHPDYFERRTEREFLRSVLADQELGVTVFELSSGNRVVASRVAFRFGSDLYLYYSGYALDHAAYSVMTALTDRILQWAVDEGITGVNLSPGMDRSKQRWLPEVVDYHEAMVHSEMLRSRASAAVFGAVTDFRQRRFGAQQRGGPIVGDNKPRSL
jgi:CelD/BcsL family acetyltransferase involved in cellulose biosynthesis